MSDIHALSGAFALDALNDMERAEFQRHLATCAACQAEVEGLREAAATLADLSAAPPPPDLRAKVLAGAKMVRPLPPQAAEPHPTKRRIPRLAAAAAAALILGIGAGATTVWRPWEPDTVQLSMADRIQQAPDARTWTQSLPTGGRVTVTRSKSIGAAVWKASGLDPAPAGRVYELWLQASDESLSPAGLMSAGDGEVVLRGDASHAIGAGLTEEPSGGSPAPTTKPLVFFDFRVKS